MFVKKLFFPFFRCQKKLTVGVTDETMLKSKKLNDLIEPVEQRIKVVSQFLKEIRGASGENFVTPISDPFGPAITDETLQCIVGKLKLHQSFKYSKTPQ